MRVPLWVQQGGNMDPGAVLVPVSFGDGSLSCGVGTAGSWGGGGGGGVGGTFCRGRPVC